jgi:putative tricarboxylic transport membrane protein
MSTTTDTEQGQGRAEYLVCAFLALLGVVVLANTAMVHAPPNSNDPAGPRIVPYIVGGALVVLAGALAVIIHRGDHAVGEEGEDVDLSAPMDVRTILLLIATFVVHIALIDWAGWVIAGGLLFYGATFALGSRHYVRNLFIAAAMGLVTFYGFTLALGVNLPAGILQGIL